MKGEGEEVEGGEEGEEDGEEGREEGRDVLAIVGSYKQHPQRASWRIL